MSVFDYNALFYDNFDQVYAFWEIGSLVSIPFRGNSDQKRIIQL